MTLGQLSQSNQLTSDGVAATKQYSLHTLSKHGERGRRSNILSIDIPDVTA